MAFQGLTTPKSDGHGDVFAPEYGAMIVHVQRESGVAHRTFVFTPWQVRLLRAFRHRVTRLILAAILLSWGYLAVQAARVPLLTRRIAHMERDAARLDTLQATLGELQTRYDQLQTMLSRPVQAPAATNPRPNGSRP